jgi:hypothetical protein
MKTKQLLTITLLTLLGVLYVNTASAQFKFGVRGGVDVISTKLDKNILHVSNRLGFQVGPTAEFTVPLVGFGVDASVLYGFKEYKVSQIQADNSLSNYNYISIPINLKQRFTLGPVGIFITGGAYGNVKIGDDGVDNVLKVPEVYQHKNYIFGLGAGAGVSLFNHLDLGMYFRGDLTDNYKEESLDAGKLLNKKYQSWSVGTTYFF